MVYLIYNFNGLNVSARKFDQFIATLNIAANDCNSDGDEVFKFEPILKHTFNITKTDVTHMIHKNEKENLSRFGFVDIVSTGPFMSDFKSPKCIVCTVTESDLPDAIILYTVKNDTLCVCAPMMDQCHSYENVVHDYIQSIASNNTFCAWKYDEDLWNDIFKQPTLHDRFHNLTHALLVSTTGLYFDARGKTSDGTLEDSDIAAFKDMPHYNELISIIVRHFSCIDAINSDRYSCDCGNLNSRLYVGAVCPKCNTVCHRIKAGEMTVVFDKAVEKEVEQHFTVHGGCGYMSSKYDEMIKDNDRQRKVCRPDKDPCKPPKWLIRLYSNPIDNDGELPEKVKLHRLLSYMADYTASWTECCDAHSAQQMKDILPLLMRCKLILEGKRMH